MAADVKWIKIVTDVFDDEKILMIEGMPEGDSIIVIWFKLLCLAGKQNNNGVFLFSMTMPYTDEMLASIFRRPLNVVKLALKTFEAFGMIKIIDSVVIVKNWNKYQDGDKLEMLRERNRARVAAHRERQKEKQKAENCNDYSNVTSNVTGNVTGNVTVTEEERSKEEEEERDKDKELEFHSFTHSTREAEEPKIEVSDVETYRRRLGGTLGQGLVFISTEQFDDLLTRMSLDEFDYYVKVIAECEKNGQHFKKKTHYQAILDMVEADRGVRK